MSCDDESTVMSQCLTKRKRERERTRLAWLAREREKQRFHLVCVVKREREREREREIFRLEESLCCARHGQMRIWISESVNSLSLSLSTWSCGEDFRAGSWYLLVAKMNVMRRLKSIASGRTSVSSDPVSNAFSLQFIFQNALSQDWFL